MFGPIQKNIQCVLKMFNIWSKKMLQTCFCKNVKHLQKNYVHEKYTICIKSRHNKIYDYENISLDILQYNILVFWSTRVKI